MVVAAAAGTRLAVGAALEVAGAAGRSNADRDLRPRRQILSRLLPLRGAAGASAPGHAAPPPARTLGGAALGIRRQRICAGGVDDARSLADDRNGKAQPRKAVR